MAKDAKERLEGAPDWHGTHLDDMNYEWYPEEKLEIERYCEKIMKNIEEEEMTPLERFKAHMAGEPKDRKLICVNTVVIYSTRTLDGYADALKPIDLMRYPKLMVKAFLATMARFKSDYPSQHNPTHAEELWGGSAKMIDMGLPVMKGEPPIKSIEDLEGLEVPDPMTAGLYPGWLWVNRELRRIIDRYQLPVPLWSSICPGSAEMVMYSLLGWNPFMKALRKDQELAKRCCDLTHQFLMKLGKTMIDVANPDAMYT